MSRILMLVGLLVVINLVSLSAAEPELRLVHVVFRHGDRTPDSDETYPTNPYGNYTYFPTGRGGLTNGGKDREYQLGEVLKSLYGDFLGSTYYPAMLVARSTDYDRTKMSLQLVLSSLFPPTDNQTWNKNLLWQPIPATYEPWEDDFLLCPDWQEQYFTEYDLVRNSSEVMEKVAELDDVMEAVGNYTGMNITDPSDLYMLYHGFAAVESAGLPLPDWVSEFYPSGGILNGTELYYEMMSYNDDLKKLNGGYMLGKIVSDAQNLTDGTLEEGRKLYVYSAHETNVASLLLALGVWEPHVPAYSSAVFVELWEEDGEYYFKVLYYLGDPSETIVKVIPGCTELCPIDTFVELLEPVTTTYSDS